MYVVPTRFSSYCLCYCLLYAYLSVGGDRGVHIAVNSFSFHFTPFRHSAAAYIYHSKPAMQSRKRCSLDGAENGHRKRSSPQKDRFSFGFAQSVKFEPNYPESFVSFADGIREDVSEMMAAGARVINQSLKVIFPFSTSSNSSNTSDTLASAETDLAAEYEEINKRRTDDMFKLKTVQTEDALRLRFPTKKIVTRLPLTPPNVEHTTIDDTKVTNDENAPPVNNTKDKKLLLDKLKDNPTIEVLLL